jgi:hypothetical protein
LGTLPSPGGHGNVLLDQLAATWGVEPHPEGQIAWVSDGGRVADSRVSIGLLRGWRPWSPGKEGRERRRTSSKAGSRDRRGGPIQGDVEARMNQVGDAAAVRAYVSEHLDQMLAELIGWVRLRSVAGLPEHQPDLQRSANWLAGAT